MGWGNEKGQMCFCLLVMVLSFSGDVNCYFDGVCLFHFLFEKTNKLAGKHRLMIVQKQ